MSDWVLIAVLGTVTLGAVNVLDSHLIGRRLPSLRAFLLPASTFILLLTLVVMFLAPLPVGVSGGTLAAAIASGIIRAISIVLLLNIYRSEEVSWAVPVYHTYPVFVALMAVPFLGESLGLLQWLAIGVMVSGTLLIAIRRNAAGGIRWLGRPLLLLLAAALLNAVADVTGKYALGEISFWNMYWIGSLCLVVMFLGFSLRRSVLREVLALPRLGRLGALMVFNETLAMVGILLVFQAMALGPVSLVSAITGARPIFVFFLALAINRLLPGSLLRVDTGRRAVLLRLAATLLIGIGIALIYLA
ncbi:MAG: EamA family transporter [Dehalogenimonas sp.]|jgi:drug/metabolite transporter (DMT)-like permease|uniref:EamA family transporter n=1 Tax=Candidatus Dehalogenimonas loeffleri TaxID=3127115 RepID=A0ABZ2J4Y9_9CHLR|nr:EamA family transporter [Dehalogenimonas sp.]